MSDSEAVDDELLRMTGNPKVAESVKESLRELSKGAGGPDLAEMAKELLAGRTSLRDIGQSAAYGSQLSDAFANYQQWQSDLSPEDREKLEKEAREHFGDRG